MSSGTVAPWSSSAQESTAPRSPYGSATRGSRPPSEATSTPTCPSKNARSPERRHDKPHPDATGRPTGYSPFSTACKSKAIMQPLSRQNLHSARDPPRAGHNRLPYITDGASPSADRARPGCSSAGSEGRRRPQDLCLVVTEGDGKVEALRLQLGALHAPPKERV